MLLLDPETANHEPAGLNAPWLMVESVKGTLTPEPKLTPLLVKKVIELPNMLAARVLPLSSKVLTVTGKPGEPLRAVILYTLVSVAALTASERHSRRSILIARNIFIDTYVNKGS